MAGTEWWATDNRIHLQDQNKPQFLSSGQLRKIETS